MWEGVIKIFEFVLEKIKKSCVKKIKLRKNIDNIFFCELFYIWSLFHGKIFRSCYGKLYELKMNISRKLREIKVCFQTNLEETIKLTIAYIQA